MEESPRRQARELVLKRLYAAEIDEASLDDINEFIVADTPLSAKNLKFVSDYFALVRRKIEWADGIISALAKNWDVGRMAIVDRIILRMAMVELKEMPDIPVRVAMNEAIELAKKYSTSESSSFINGILDTYLKNIDSF